MQTLFLDKNTNMLNVIDINPDIHSEVKKYIDCDNWDAPLHRIGQIRYRIIVDDNSWPLEDILHSDERVSAVTSSGRPLLFGNILFFRDGDMLDELTEDDIRNITRHTVTLPSKGLVVVVSE